MSTGESFTAVVAVEVEGAMVVEVVAVVVRAELGMVGVVWAVQATRTRATGKTRVTLGRSLGLLPGSWNTLSPEFGHDAFASRTGT